jgi:hypothetical protein
MITLTTTTARALMDHILAHTPPEELEGVTSPGIAITPRCHPGNVAIMLERTPENRIEVRLECTRCDESPVRLILGEDHRYDDQTLPELETLEIEPPEAPGNDKIH